jgi:type II secretory pathway pseudopilin PulG
MKLPRQSPVGQTVLSASEGDCPPPVGVRGTDSPANWQAGKPALQSAFTLVEIAIALAIIGFALVAIIGILPMGIDVQKNNRRETIINQDANYLMDAIRGGARGLDDLTNYVTTITNYWTRYSTNGDRLTPSATPYDNYDSYTNAQANDPLSANYLLWPDNRFWVTSVDPPVKDFRITNGFRIMGVLSTPKYVPSRNPLDPPGSYFSNYVVVYMRALSGAALEKYPQTNEIIRESAFAYRLIPEIVPYGSSSNTYFDSTWTNYLDPAIVIDTNAVSSRLHDWITAGRGDPNPGITNTPNFASIASNPAEVAARAHNWMLAKNLNTNLYDVRLLFRWPLLPRGKIGNGRQVYRTLFSGTQIVTNDPADVPLINVPLYLFQPRTFAANAP